MTKSLQVITQPNQKVGALNVKRLDHYVNRVRKHYLNHSSSFIASKQQISDDEALLYNEYLQRCSANGVLKPINISEFLIQSRAETDASQARSAKTGLKKTKMQQLA
jgi:hypothetical protein